MKLFKVETVTGETRHVVTDDISLAIELATADILASLPSGCDEELLEENAVIARVVLVANNLVQISDD